MQDMEALYKEYAIQVYKYAYTLCHDEHTAEELTQETFYQAIRGIDRYEGKCKMYVWLCQITKHIWYKELGRKKKEQKTELTEEISTGQNVEEAVAAKDEKMRLFQKLHSLPEPMREVLYLRLTGEFSFREIGEILGKDETWARVTFYRGKQKLMKGRDEYEM